MKGSCYFLYSPEDKIRKGIIQDPIVTHADTILYRAIKMGASDIHLQPEETTTRVRFRIDGLLYDQEMCDHDHHIHLVSRFKILSSLDISLSRLPQDGKFKVVIRVSNGANTSVQAIDFRVSTFPSIYGEKMVLRILDRSRSILDLESLGFSKSVLEEVYKLLKKQNGFFLVTGPTGVGKTTTLYAMLTRLNHPTCNIVTMEDPVEYDLQGISQSQVNERAGLSFQNGLRSLLRQDPDVIMIGEIRDEPTVNIAIEAALTGHLVLSTLHTNNAIEAVTRLCEMGIAPFLVSATLTGVLAQRLVRILCPECKVKRQLTHGERAILSSYGSDDISEVYESPGCGNCFNLGHKGRTSVTELLVINDTLREQIINNLSSENFYNKAKEISLCTLAESGLAKVKEGTISLEEFLRIIN